MLKNKIKHAKGLIVAVFVVIAAITLRGLSYDMPPGALKHIFGYMRSSLYIGLFAVWGYSMQRRIMVRPVRRSLIAAVLMVGWMAVRTVKYNLHIDNPLPGRLLWYSYYIFMLSLPVLCLLVAFSLGKPEGYRLPKRAYLLLVPTVLLIILVLTNDFHQHIFIFPADKPWTDRDYAYGVGYWFASGLAYLCAAAAFVMMFIKCRVPHSRKYLWQPLVPFSVGVLYGILYVSDVQWLFVIAGDLTAFQCLFFAATLESCTRCGLIQSNTNYKELFGISTIAMQITDEEYHLLLSSDTAQAVPTDTLRQTETEPVMLPGHIRLSGAPIADGHVLWTEDVSELAEVISDLEDLDEDLEGRHTVLHEEYETRHRRQSLEEKNRLYNQIQLQTEGKITRLSQLTQSLAETKDTAEIRMLTVEIAVLTAYLKRRNNLIFIAEENGSVPASELTYCLKESISNLSLSGASCNLKVSLTEPLPFEQVTVLYDAFEAAAEICVRTLSTLFVVIRIKNNAPVLFMNILCDTDLSGLARDGFDVVCEDEGEWTLTTGGEKR